MQWPIQDAKARFSELLKECMNQGPQIISKHGTQMAVLIPINTPDLPLDGESKELS